MHFINTFLNMNRLRVKKVIATIVCVTILLSACNGGISSPNSSTKEEPNMESLHALYYDRLIQAAEEAFREQVEDPDLLEAFPYLPALYTYVSPEGETVYLFGTSQAYDPDTPWFPDYVKYALEESRCVITAHPEVNYSKEDLAYAEECMAQSPVGFSDELLETLETYREKRGLAGPEITQVRPLYWFLAKKWEWPEMQMNDVIWNMAEGKERVLAYDGKDVIDRMNQLDTKTEAILVVSGMARNSNSDRALQSIGMENGSCMGTTGTYTPMIGGMTASFAMVSRRTGRNLQRSRELLPIRPAMERTAQKHILQMPISSIRKWFSSRTARTF